MSDLRGLDQPQYEDEDEDIFQSAFMSSNSNTGKVKISGDGLGHINHYAYSQQQQQTAMYEEDEKKDPQKEHDDQEEYSEIPINTPTVQQQQAEVQTDFPAPTRYIKKAMSVEQQAARYVRDEYSSPEEIAEEEGEDKFIEISVSDPHRVGDGISCFMAYKVTTKTNMRIFQRDVFTVTRRFSDFLGVHEKLSEKYLKKGRIIPPAPEKNLVGTTKFKMSSANGPKNAVPSTPDENPNQEQAEFITRRRLALERFVNRVALHPVLRRDAIFVEFLESGRELPRATSTSALSSASVFRLLGKVGDTVSKMTYKMEENDPWYEEKVQQIESLETQLKKLYGIIENLVQCRQDLAASTGSFAQSAAALSSTEEAHTLSRALAHLARVEERVEQVHQQQAEADYFYLFELVKDYVALIGAVKEALAERSKAFQSWQHAQSMVIKKKEQRARLEMGGRHEKIPVANEEVLEWEARLDECQDNFNKISEVIKVEIDLFERYRVKDFKCAILKYLESLMTAQLQLVKHWEEFIPEVKSILF